MNTTEFLVSRYASDALCSMSATAKNDSRCGVELWNQLFEILASKNGFFAFESAMHLYPLGGDSEGIELIEWNRFDVWKKGYPNSRLKESICFAANVFGDQFCLDAGGVGLMDAETGDVEEIATNLEGWVNAVLKEPDYHLGFQLAHSWQEENGAIEPGMRLVPKVPFVCGGDFEVFTPVRQEVAQHRKDIVIRLYSAQVVLCG